MLMCSIKGYILDLKATFLVIVCTVWGSIKLKFIRQNIASYKLAITEFIRIT